MLAKNLLRMNRMQFFPVTVVSGVIKINKSLKFHVHPICKEKALKKSLRRPISVLSKFLRKSILIKSLRY
jgi:hypothetical protein